MSSHSPNAAPAAVLANCAPLPEPCVAFVPSAVQAFLRRGERMATVTAPWTVWNDARALREVELPALADPTLEAVEEQQPVAAAPTPTLQSVIDELLFAPIDAPTLDPSQVGAPCAFAAGDGATTAQDSTADMDWSGSPCAASMATSASTAVATAPQPEAAMDWSGGSCAPCADTSAPASMPLPNEEPALGWSEPTCPTCMATTATDAAMDEAADDEEPLWLELEDEEEFDAPRASDATPPTADEGAADASHADCAVENVDATQASEEFVEVATPTAAAEATSDEHAQLVAEVGAEPATIADTETASAEVAQAVDDVVAEIATVAETDAASSDELPATPEPVAAEATAAATETVDVEEAVPATTAAEADALDAILATDAPAPTNDDAPAFAHAAAAASESAWANDHAASQPFVEPDRTDETSEAASLDEIAPWSPASDDGAAVAVAEPEVAVAVAEAEFAVAEPAVATPTLAATATVVEQTVGATEPPPAPPVVATQASRNSADADLEQMQHHVLTALEQVQSNLTTALEQLRAVTPPDVSPAIAELRAELTRQGELLTSNVDAVKQLGAQVTQLDASVQQAAAAKPTTPSPTQVPAPHFAPSAEPTSWLAPLATASLGATWSVLLWWKTGSTALAAGMLVAANLVAALQLTRARD